jgi:hypothetical protein
VAKSKDFTLFVDSPLGGLRRDTSYQNEPPYSCIDLRNFWTVDVRDGRDVLATRPAQAEYDFPDTPINMAAQLHLPSPTMFAAANGKLYKLTDEDAATWLQISSAVGVTAGRPVDSAPFFKRLLIANTDDAVVYNDADGTLVTLASIVVTGTAPTDCRLAMTFAGAPWLSGAPDNPHVFTCGRTGDITDWDSSQDDEGGAFESTGEFLGLITEPLTAMFAFAEDRAILGCEESTWMLTGHPRRGGRLEIVSTGTGILGQWAWTATPSGQVFFMSHNGLMQMDRTQFGTLVLSEVSKKKIPDELLGLPIDPFNPTVCVGYDSRWNALIITVRGDRQQAWRYGLKNGSFEQMDLSEYPTIMREFGPLVSPDKSGLIMCGDSMLRFDRAAVETMDARALIGPVKISNTLNRSSRIDQAAVLIGGGSNDPDAVVRFHTGPNAHIAALRALSDVDNYKHEVTSNVAGTCFPQLHGTAVVLTIEQTNSSKRIIFDGAELQLSEGGITRDEGLMPPVITIPETTINIPTT